MKMLRLSNRRRSCEKKSAKPKHSHIMIRLMTIIEVPIIRILLGFSLIMLISGIYQYFTDVMETKHIIKTCIGIIILIILYFRNYLQKETLLKSFKDSLPYFTALFLLGDLAGVEWMVLVLAAIIVVADFAGDG